MKKSKLANKGITDDLRLILRLYNPLTIGTILFLFCIFYLFPIKFVPDYFHVSEIENLRTFIWTLFAATLGFSGLILTVVLLSYNFYQKSTRRQTIDFIFDNTYLKILFSGFFAIIFVQLTAFLLVNKTNRTDIIAVIYLVFCLTATFLLLQLPLAILGLRYSTSNKKLDKILRAISEQDVFQIANGIRDTDEFTIDDLEGNKLVIIKDIGVSAIRDSDWALPQKILSDTFDLVNSSLKDSLVNLEEIIHINLWISRHFQRAALKSSDTLTMNVILANVLSVYHQLLTAKVYKRRLYQQLDDFSKELIVSTIQAKDFSEIREEWVKNYITIMEKGICSLSFDDTALPTKHYVFGMRVKDIHYPHAEDYYQFWHYLTHSQFDVVIDTLEAAATHKDNRVLRYYHWTIQSLVNTVVEKSTLTVSQKRTYLSEFLFNISKLETIAVSNGWSDELGIITHFHIESWAEKQWFDLFRYGLFIQSRAIKAQIKMGSTYRSLLDEFFLLARTIASSKKIDISVKEEIFSYVIETGLKLHDNRGDSKRLEYDIQYQLHWLSIDYLEKVHDLSEVAEKYRQAIERATTGFDFSQMPDF